MDEKVSTTQACVTNLLGVEGSIRDFTRRAVLKLVSEPGWDANFREPPRPATQEWPERPVGWEKKRLAEWRRECEAISDRARRAHTDWNAERLFRRNWLIDAWFLLHEGGLDAEAAQVAEILAGTWCVWIENEANRQNLLEAMPPGRRAWCLGPR